MVEQWSAEIAIAADTAARLINRQFRALRPARLRKIGEGFDNTVFRVNDGWVFRFPRRRIAAELIETECALLPQLAALRLPLSIPVPEFAGEPDRKEHYPWSFAGYRYIHGKAPHRLSERQRLASAEPLAEFLKELHRFPIERASRIGAPPDRLARLDIGKRLATLEENAAKAVRAGLWPDRETLQGYIRTLRPEDPSVVSAKIALVHGDFHLRNVLVDRAGALCGVIDWGDLHIGHPAVDLGFMYSFVPVEGRRRFFEIYGETDGATERLSRFRTVFTNLYLLLYGGDRNDKELVVAAREGLRIALA